MGANDKKKMKEKEKKKKKKKKNKPTPDDDGGNNGKLITDARFASMHSDPRFSELRKKQNKVEIDSRFKRAFTDENFVTSKAPVDKRGKPKKKKNDAAANPLQRYYTLEDEKGRDLGEKSQKNDEESESEDEKAKLKDESEESSSSSSEEEEEVESDDSSSTSMSGISDSDEEDAAYQEEEEEKIPEIDQETHRLAVVNMDWSEVKAVDLYVMLSSFLPKGGHIVSVAVYPSEFGLKRMEEEAVRGPVGLFDDEKNNNDDEGSEDDEDEIDTEKLRAYELSRLRYYFAVVECDSIATADYLYKTCDGLEFERSSLKLDLRFIPDSMEFEHQPRDVAKNAPADYEGLDFNTRALQQSKIHLTWDDDEPHRAKALKRKFNTEQLAELELQEFLASDENESIDSEDDDDQIEIGSVKKQKNRDMYLSLIHSHGGLDENDEEEHQDMEVTFNTGLEDLSKRILEKKDRKSETVWEAYLRKRREKKKAGKKRSKDSSEDHSSDTDEGPAEQPDDFFIEEPSEKRSKPAQGKNATKKKQNEGAEASRAELELLLADDNGAPDTNMKGYNLKRKMMKGKKGKEILDEGKLPTVDYDDPRFSALFISPLFALDPTDPQFKRSAAYARQMAHKQRSEIENKGTKQPSELPSVGFMSNKTDDYYQETNADNRTSRKEKHELSSLVKSIKMKSKQKPLHHKVTRDKMSRKKSKLANR